MNPRVNSVTPNDDYTLALTFTNGEARLFDVTPYLESGVFQELKDMALFRTAEVSMGTVQWIHGQDFAWIRSTKKVRLWPMPPESRQAACPSMA
jgi:hypothetical protein